MANKPDTLVEQPHWLRQLIAFLFRLLGLERLPKRATSWPQSIEPSRGGPAPTEAPPPATPVESPKEAPKDPEVEQPKVPEPPKVGPPPTVGPPPPGVPEIIPPADTLPEDLEDPVPDPADSDVYDLKPGYFNNISGFIASEYRKPFYQSGRNLLKFKGKLPPLKPEQRTHIACHISGIEFGTSSSRRRFWENVIKAGKLPGEVLERYDLGDISDTAERIALHERFWKVPYHVVGLVNGDILFNNELDSYTFHGNYLNDEAIGLSAEANLPGLSSNYKVGTHTEVDDFWIETNRKAFLVAFELGMEANLPITGVRCHRQASSGRVGDPGEQYFKLVLKPMAERLGLKIDVHYKVGTGFPIPVEWDSRGSVDYRGKKVA